MSMPKTSSSERSKLGDLSEERITEFRRDGCTVVRGLCSKEEVVSVRSRIAEAVAKQSQGIAALSERSSTYARAFLQLRFATSVTRTTTESSHHQAFDATPPVDADACATTRPPARQKPAQTRCTALRALCDRCALGTHP